MKSSTLIALTVFAALSLAFVATRERTVNEGVHHLSFPPASAEAFTQVELGAVTLAAVDGGWNVSSGGQTFAADQSQAQALTRELAAVKAGDFVTDRTERHAELEVDQAKAVPVRARTSSGVVRDLLVGKPSKRGGVYARSAGSNEVFVITGSLGSQAHRALKDWRDRHVTTAPLALVTAVQVVPATGPAFGLTKEGSGWVLDGPTPPGFRFDAEAAGKLVTQATSLIAQDFADTFDPVATTLTLKTGSGSHVLELTGKRADGTFGLRVDHAGQLFVLPAWQAEPLTRDLEGLRDLRLLPVDPRDVKAFTVIGAKGRATVVREGESSWKVVEPKVLPSGFEFDPQQVDSQLRSLTSVKGSRLATVPAAKAGLGSPTVELSVAGRAPVSLRFGSAEGGELYARGFDDQVVLVPATARARFEAGLDLFKKAPAPQAMGLDQLPPDVRRQLEAQLQTRH